MDILYDSTRTKDLTSSLCFKNTLIFPFQSLEGKIEGNMEKRKDRTSLTRMPDGSTIKSL